MLRAVVGVLLCAIVSAGAVCADDQERLTKLIRELVDGDDEARWTAVWELGKIGASARRAEPELLQALGDSDEYVRARAAVVMLRFGADPQTVRPLLDDRDNSVRFRVAEALLAIHGDVASAAPVLLDLRSDSSQELKTPSSVDDVLHSLSPKIAREMQSFLIESVRKKKLDDSVLQTLPDLGPLDEALVPLLVELVKARPALGLDVTSLLMKIGPGAKEALPLLQKLAGDRDPKLALRATAALVAILPENDECVSRLSAALVGPYPELQVLAQDLVHDLGPRGAGAAAALVAAMTDETRRPSESFRSACWQTLGNLGKAGACAIANALERRPANDALTDMLQALQMLGPDAQLATATLVALLSDAKIETAIRVEAINAVAAVGPSAKAAAPTLHRDLDSDSALVRAAAVEALAKIGSPSDDLRARLRLLLADSDSEVRLTSGVALLMLDEDPQAVFPTLVALIDESDPDACNRTLVALRSLGPRAAPAIPKLVTALAFEKGVAAGFGGFQLSSGAVYCLAAIGAPAVPELILALENQDARSRAYAAQALETIGPPAKHSVAALRAVLNDDRNVAFNVGCMGFEHSVGERAMMALGGIGPGAGAAVPDLVAILKRELARQEINDNGRLALTVDALGGIGPPAGAATPQLDELVRRDDLELRLRARLLTALARIVPDSPGVVPRILQLFAEIRDEAGSDWMFMSEFSALTEAIVSMKKLRRFLLADLSALCECNVLSYTYRCDAAHAALRIDPDNEPARRYLDWASKHSDWLLRDRANEILDELRQPAK